MSDYHRAGRQARDAADNVIEAYESIINAACAITFLAFRVGHAPEKRWCGRALAEDLQWCRHAIAKVLKQVLP